jgi:hypothetical protein
MTFGKGVATVRRLAILLSANDLDERGNTGSASCSLTQLNRIEVFATTLQPHADLGGKTRIQRGKQNTDELAFETFRL